MSMVELVGVAIDKQFDIVAQHVRYDLKKECPKRTGEAASSIEIQKISPSTIFVGSDNLHLFFADQGNHPGHNGKIYPIRAKALIITDKNGRGVAFRSRSSTYDGKHFVAKVANKYR